MTDQHEMLSLHYVCNITRVCGALTAERIRSGLIWTEVCLQSDLESEAQQAARHHVTRTH